MKDLPGHRQLYHKKRKLVFWGENDMPDMNTNTFPFPCHLKDHFFNFIIQPTALFRLFQDEWYSMSIQVGVFSVWLATMLVTVTSFLTSRSLRRMKPGSFGIPGHCVSVFFRNSGPWSQLFGVRNGSMLSPHYASSAGFCLEFKNLHWFTFDMFWMTAVLFATKVWYLLVLFRIYFRMFWLSVQKLDSWRSICSFDWIILSIRAASLRGVTLDLSFPC